MVFTESILVSRLEVEVQVRSTFFASHFLLFKIWKIIISRYVITSMPSSIKTVIFSTEQATKVNEKKCSISLLLME